MYRALYRKWRPQRFADVVGQAPIVTALQNQIAAGRIGHAYLFTGTRGTGKTTCAKIFAKAVNCLDHSSPDPCCQCEVCKGIDSGAIMDIIEMDAASNNGVDDIRDLRDEVAYLPSVCRYKVYIIDEVHMLSTQAFNALLKTMEEPPEHVIFILATTEVQKVPVTILSRCQRYDFARITADDIAGRLRYVAEQEKIDLDPNAAQLIGRLADGAMRDALSILDTCAGVDNKVDEALVRRMAGVTDRGYLFEISDAIAARDSVCRAGKDFRPAPAKRGHAPPLHGAGGPLPQPDALCPAGRHLAADRHLTRRRGRLSAAQGFPAGRRHPRYQRLWFRAGKNEPRH
ncbi:DNA polymerase III subunit gamma/tau [Gemmiger sp.]|uniref:DNA polymerase III subunit gamma/tau n=1 Tax=Gemmiger sp. TaxID=2049027 RepID=UPI00352293AC